MCGARSRFHAPTNRTCTHFIKIAAVHHRNLINDKPFGFLPVGLVSWELRAALANACERVERDAADVRCRYACRCGHKGAFGGEGLDDLLEEEGFASARPPRKEQAASVHGSVKDFYSQDVKTKFGV